MAKLFGKNGAISKFGKRNIVIVCAVLLIGLAVYLNYLWYYDSLNNLGYGDNNMSDQVGAGDDQNASAGAEDNTEAYFSATQLSRQQARDEALEVLQGVVSSESALEVTKEEALADISRIATEIEKESNIEALVLAKGFEKCIAVVNGDSASVIVKTDGELVNSQIAQISEIVYTSAGILPANTKIIQK
ncbi:MAG: SpoIIIAH-like family protein [Clostridia bacterium]|nr:SpoIIIAH-like family protein [Clostridia bacterium]MBQ5800264.1 SpoIIIAH-like family protein [Clostridia bacterium]